MLLFNIIMIVYNFDVYFIMWKKSLYLLHTNLLHKIESFIHISFFKLKLQFEN